MPDALRLSGLHRALKLNEFSMNCRPDKAFTPHPARATNTSTATCIKLESLIFARCISLKYSFDMFFITYIININNYPF
ncbi:TPA: hypothetical protein ACIYEP_005266, partial [Escherichia coli]